MKKIIFILAAIILSMSLLLVGCDTEPEDNNGTGTEGEAGGETGGTEGEVGGETGGTEGEGGAEGPDIPVNPDNNGDSAADPDQPAESGTPAGPFIFNDITIALGDSLPLVTTVGEGTEAKALTYTSSGNQVSVENGVLKAKSVTTEAVKVTVKAENYEASFSVNVLPKEDKTYVFSNITLTVGDKVPVLSVVDGNQIDYSFRGAAFEIKNGYISALMKTTTPVTVTATAKNFKATFKVSVAEAEQGGESGGNQGGETGPVDYGTITIDAPSAIYTNYSGKPITVTFSNPDYASDVTYTTNNDKVYVHNGKIYARGTFEKAVNVTVTAKTPYHTKQFNVSVSEYNGDVSAERKVSYYENQIIKESNKGGIIFVGDSYFDGYTQGAIPFWEDFYEDYSGKKAFLMGISSSQIHQLETVSERIVYPMAPSEIVVHIGFNDVHHGPLTPDALAARIIALFETYRRELPNVKIYFCSIEPKKGAHVTSHQFYHSSFVEAPAVNAKIKEYAQSHSWLTYVDTRSLAMNSDETVNESFFVSRDMSHPTLQSYDSYRKLIEMARGTWEESTADKIAKNQAAVESAAAEAKKSGDVHEIKNTAGVSLQNVAKYYTDSSSAALTTYYSITGYMDISNIAKSSAHIQLRLNATTNDRFLLWDSNGNGKLGICAPFAGIANETANGAHTDALDTTKAVTIKWQVIVTGKTAYLFINDVLVMSGNPSGLTYFNISIQGGDIALYGVSVTTKAQSATEYAAILQKFGVSE